MDPCKQNVNFEKFVEFVLDDGDDLAAIFYHQMKNPWKNLSDPTSQGSEHNQKW